MSALTTRRLRPPRPDDYPSRLHSERLAARVGLWLGAAFAICFITGLFSHLIQHPPLWFGWPTRPVWLYRITQGLHISTGVAAIPLLLVKLWTVSPRFWQWPPITSVVNALERLSIFVLVGAAFFQLISGLLNVAEWYPWKFFFPPVHYAVAWVAIGALAVHIAVKLPIIRRALTGGADAEPVTGPDMVGPDMVGPDMMGPDTAGPDTRSDRNSRSGPLSRRGLLAAALGSAGIAVLATVGDKVPALRTVSVLAQRNGTGPQGLPVNRSAAAAGVIKKVTDPGYRVTLVSAAGEHSFTVAQLRALPQTTAVLPISCVEGWSQSASWTGVRLRDLLQAAGIQQSQGVRMVSAEQGTYAVSMVTPAVAADDLTLIALELEGRPLDIDHGYPARLMAPDRPGVMQTKWLERIEVL